MKRLYFMGIQFFLIVACSNDRSFPLHELPPSVKKSFQTHFPEATKANWIMYNFDFQANFKVKDIEFYALFDENGELYIHRKEISSADIDNDILEKVKATYPDFSICDMYEIIDRGKIMYKFEMDKILIEKQTVFYMDSEIFQ